jgi:hypothetical protein
MHRRARERPCVICCCPRYVLLTIAIAGTLGFVGAAARYPHAIVYLALPLAIFALLVILGIHDLTQASCVTGRQTAVYFI